MKSSKHIRKPLTLFISAVIAASTASTMAQNDTSTPRLALEEVVVTAQRRAQSLQDVPVAVSAIDGNLLKESGTTDLLNLQMLVPSLTMEQSKGPGFATFRIRGVGNLGNIPNFEPAVGLFIDGAYRSKSGLGVGQLVDVDRVEVLRGPQSTLYGRNVTAGLISVITKRPTDELEGFMEVDAGNYNASVIRASVSGPLADNVQGRLSGFWEQRDGTFEDINLNTEPNEKESWAVRGQLAFQPTDKLSILVIGGYSEKDADCCNQDVDLGALGAAFSGIVMGSAPDTDPTNRVMQFSDTNTYEDEAKELTLKIEYDFDSFVLTSLTSYDDFEIFGVLDSEQTPMDVVTFYDRQEAETLSQEFRFTSESGGDFDWMAGLAYYKNDFTRGSLDAGEPTTTVGVDVLLPLFQAPPALGGLPGDASFFKSTYDTENYSIFAQGNWHLSERLTLGAGVRWFTEEKDMAIDSRAEVGIFPSYALITTVPAPVEGNRDTDQVAWNLSASFHSTDDIMLYGSVSQGAKGGGFNGDWDGRGALSVDDREFDDEEVLNYELGVKTSLLESRLTLNANVFYSEFDDFQNASFLGLNFLVDNAAEVTTSGLEIDTVALLTSWLTVDFSYTYLDAKYEEFSTGSCYFGRAPDNPVANTCDLSGDALPLAPENRYHLGILGHWSVASGELYGRADYSWTDETETDNALDPRGVQDSYGILNGRVGWRNDSFDMAAWIMNATDEEVVTLSAPQTLFGSVDGGRQVYLNDPKTYGVTLRYSF
ncbi:MAG: TonB-dependent receptor [Halioglobus sp.]